MSSNDKYFAIGLIGIVMIFGSVGFELAKPAATVPQEIVKLERVVIVGKRAETAMVAQLPRVVIEGRRVVQADDLHVADAKLLGKAI